jgi:UDP-3-O-[3-hydroxymyristoyl] glucosamine N-acyltransferase
MSLKSFTLAELAAYTKSQLVGNPDHRITGVADLNTADNCDASFLANQRYEQAMRDSKAGVIFIDPKTTVTPEKNFLINENPSRAFQYVVDEFFKEKQEISGFSGIHPSAVVHPTCSIANNVTIAPHAVIDKNAIIAEGTFIGSGCYIGPFATIGKNCILHSNVTIREHCIIGNRVILQPGVVIGSCGFGYTTTKEGKHQKLNQLGNVTIEDDVEIGANTTIDRSRFKTTSIGSGSKIDNQVQIGHGVVLGKDNIIVAQVGIAGSTTTGHHVVMGGKAAIAGHIHIGNMVMIAACSGVSKSIPDGEKYGGIPAMPLRESNRLQVLLRNIETYVNEIKELKQEVEKLKNKP